MGRSRHSSIAASGIRVTLGLEVGHVRSLEVERDLSRQSRFRGFRLFSRGSSLMHLQFSTDGEAALPRGQAQVFFDGTFSGPRPQLSAATARSNR